MKTFFDLKAAYQGLRARRLAQCGRVVLYKIVNDPPDYWLVVIRAFSEESDRPLIGHLSRFGNGVWRLAQPRDVFRHVIAHSAYAFILWVATHNANVNFAVYAREFSATPVKSLAVVLLGPCPRLSSLSRCGGFPMNWPTRLRRWLRKTCLGRLRCSRKASRMYPHSRGRRSRICCKTTFRCGCFSEESKPRWVDFCNPAEEA